MSNHNKQQQHKGRWSKYLGKNAKWQNNNAKWRATDHNEQQYQGKGDAPQQAIAITNANAMGFIHLNVHPWFVINLYLTFNLV